LANQLNSGSPRGLKTQGCELCGCRGEPGGCVPGVCGSVAGMEWCRGCYCANQKHDSIFQGKQEFLGRSAFMICLLCGKQ